MSTPASRTVLVLAANPLDTSRLRLAEEGKQIRESLKRSAQCDEFTVVSQGATSTEDLRRALLEYNPHLVHFSGHGDGEAGLILEDARGKRKLVSARALTGLFKQFPTIECVVLNACYSDVQAKAIVKHVPYVVGMNQAIGDQAAIEFATGFYDGLGYGRTYAAAYELGKSAIDLEGLPDIATPVLLEKPNQGSSKTQGKTAPQTTGKRVLIRYRDQAPEANIAQAFHERLKQIGHTPVLAAEESTWDKQWVTQIDQELRRSDYLLLLLSEATVSSDRVAGEVQTARQLTDQQSTPVILPIRVNLSPDAPLHAELWRALQTIPQSGWQSPVDTPCIVEDLSQLIAAGKVPDPLPAEPPPESQPPPESSRPLSVADLELPGGTMPLDSKFYIRREPWDTRCLQEIEHRAGLVRIKAPRQMGKTSLLARIRDHAVQLGYRPVTISFLETDERAFADFSVFLKRLCASVSKQLGLSPKQVTECWDEDLFGPKENCSDYFETELLSPLDSPLFLGLDELDRLFPYEAVSKEFLTLLRSWNEKAKVNDTWSKLRMVIAHSTESYVVLDTNSSPFNVGLAVELPEFSERQVQELVDKHGLQWSTSEVEALMDLVGGHPYLVRLALYHLAQQDMTLPQLLTDAPTDAGIYGEHLRRHLWNLQQHPDLAAAFEQVMQTERPVALEPMLAFKLNGMGLVNLQGNDVVLCHERLYRPYFRSRLRSLT